MSDRNIPNDQEMPAATLEALRGSIAKWEERAAGANIRASCSDCPLCALFNTVEKELNGTACDGCPVAAWGARYCDGTPYEDYMIERRNGRDAERIAAARRETAFLKSLLPPDHKAALKEVPK